MPWIKTCIMDLRIQFIRDWMTHRHTLVDVCTRYCVSRKTGCKWINRDMEHGPDELLERAHAAQLAAPYRAEGATGKNDANDAAAICEAASRPHMRFVPVKSIEQQSMLAVHRLREEIKEQRNACVSQIRGLLLEFGVAIPTGIRALHSALDDVLEDVTNEMNGLARMTLRRAQMHWQQLDEHLAWCDERIACHRRDNEAVKQAGELMGIGPVGASAAIATVGDFKQFKSGSQFGAWLGLVPKQQSSGGKSNLGTITKRGDPYLRTLLVQGAKSVVNSAHTRTDPISRWVHQCIPVKAMVPRRAVRIWVRSDGSTIACNKAV